MPWHDHDGVSGTGWVVMSVLMLFLLAITLIAIVMAVRAARSGPPRSAEQLLAERFARGEIDADEFERRSALLRAQVR